MTERKPSGHTNDDEISKFNDRNFSYALIYITFHISPFLIILV